MKVLQYCDRLRSCVGNWGSDKGESKMTKAMVVGTWGAFICALGCGPQYACDCLQYHGLR